MRGVVMHGPGDVRVERRDDPKIIKPTDAVIRLAATCGSAVSAPRLCGHPDPVAYGQRQRGR